MKDVEVLNQIYNEFCEWIKGVEEDDPLDPEIKYIYFVVSHNDINILQYAGCEHQPKIAFSFDYSPLEAQFFYCSQFFNLSKFDTTNFVKLFVEQMLKEKYFEKLFKGKKIEVLEFGANTMGGFEVK